ncbi:MAG: hypothetical protein ABS934_09400, partial [Psychrobacillus sp.]
AAFIHLTPRGKVLELDKKSVSTYVCPDRQMEKSEEAAPQPPQTLLFATSLRRSSFHSFDPEGQGAGARQEKRKHLCLPRQANGEKRGGSFTATACPFSFEARKEI